MTDYRTVGAHQINKWLWSKLQSFEYKTNTKAFSDYKDSGNTDGYDLVPILPSQQKPQIFDITKGLSPFIVYTYMMSPYASEWWMCREQCAYIIYDSNEERLRAIHSYMIDLLKRMDWTARELNNSNDISSLFDFKYVQVSSATGPDEFSTEGGEQGAMVIANYEYTTDMDSSEGNGLRI
jgi:hypothetical protein